VAGQTNSAGDLCRGQEWLRLPDKRKPPGDKTGVAVEWQPLIQASTLRGQAPMTLILSLLCFSGICWIMVFWGLRTRSRRLAEERTATDCRRMDPDRVQHGRRRGHKRNHLRVVSKPR
jgi:hypothetical protein